MKKKLIILFLGIIILVDSIVVKASDISIDIDSIVTNSIKDAEGYEKSLEGLVSGTFSWHPIAEGDFDSEYGNLYRLGKSTNSNNTFRYFYDYNKNFLIQYFSIGGTSGLLTWKGGVPVGYEIFS